MCGIAGIVQGQGDESSLEAPLKALCTAMRHRGPDDHGIFVSRRASGDAPLCGLAHTRLSILDLSPAGHQPMSTPDGRFTITFNGEIYNFRELRTELEKAGERFTTGTDTEVILRLHAREGDRCVERLRGMFAFAIWDAQTGTCFLARDPLGIKPLYYSLAGGRLVFASELRALIRAGLVSRRIHPGALYGYFLLGSVPEPFTLLDGVESLPAGHCLTWHEGRATRRAYWKIDFNGQAPAPADPAAHTRAALLESLERHFVSDVPVGIFLSGGIDSTALLALATRALGRRASTFCISFDQASLNEGALAARTAAHFGSDHHDWRLGAPEARQLLPEYMTVADQPSIDGFNTFCVARHARNQGMKVVLSGQGGDELFSGYPSFVRVPKLLHWGRAASVLGPATRLAGSLLERQAPQPRWRRVGHFLQNPTSVGSAYLSIRGIFTPQEAATLARSCLAHPAAADTLPQAGEFLRIDTQPTLADEIGLLELSRYMRNQLLRDSDVMSMASSLELRVPFVDHTFVDAVAAIPSARRLRPGKRLLLEAVPEIPEWVSNRPKQGFVFPFEQWLMDEWREWFATVDARAPVPLFNWYRRWSLLALENFVKTYQVQGTTLPG